MSEWKPIESAPKDDVILYFPAKTVGAYAQSTLPVMVRIGRSDAYQNRQPTHWMPLPEPPVQP